MADRYDLKLGHEGKDGRTYWDKVGAVFKHNSGDGLTIKINPGVALVGGLDGVSLCAFPPQEKGQRNDAPRGPRQEQAADLGDDQIPF